MIAKTRGFQRLAGAAFLKLRMPAIVGDFSIHPDIARPVEQQTLSLWAAGMTPVYPNAV